MCLCLKEHTIKNCRHHHHYHAGRAGCRPGPSSAELTASGATGAFFSCRPHGCGCQLLHPHLQGDTSFQILNLRSLVSVHTTTLCDGFVISSLAFISFFSVAVCQSRCLNHFISLSHSHPILHPLLLPSHDSFALSSLLSPPVLVIGCWSLTTPTKSGGRWVINHKPTCVICEQEHVFIYLFLCENG